MQKDDGADAAGARRLVRWIAAAAALPMLVSAGYAAFSAWTMATDGIHATVFFPVRGSGPDEIPALLGVAIGVAFIAAGVLTVYTIRRQLLTRGAPRPRR